MTANTRRTRCKVSVLFACLCVCVWMSDAESDAPLESEAPEPDGTNVSSSSHHTSHPLWERAAGRGTSTTKRNNASKNAKGHVSTTKYSPISSVELELRARRECDGASTLADDSEQEDDVMLDRPGKRSRRGEGLANGERNAKKVRSEEDEQDDEQEDVSVCSNYNRDDAAQALASAVFGNKKQRACDAVSDTDDSNSVTSMQIRQAQKRACPISGVECVGCTMPQRITAVDEFVFSNFNKMQPIALYKMAALVYKTKVEAPALDEGLRVPEWAWKQMMTHYLMHRMDPGMQRSENVRALSQVRKTLELSLMKEDDDTGERMLDKSNMESLMKVIALQSKELQLMNEHVDGRNVSMFAGSAPAKASTKGRPKG